MEDRGTNERGKKQEDGKRGGVEVLDLRGGGVTKEGRMEWVRVKGEERKEGRERNRRVYGGNIEGEKKGSNGIGRGESRGNN